METVSKGKKTAEKDAQFSQNVQCHLVNSIFFRTFALDRSESMGVKF